VLRPESQTIDLEMDRAPRADQTAARSGEAGLITIPTTVMDRNGRYVANLRPEDFKIYENGIEQQVSYFRLDRKAIHRSVDARCERLNAVSTGAN
jgi:hypothetical protein